MILAIVLYRIGNFFHNHGMVSVGKAFSLINRIVFSTWIPSSAKIGKRFVLGYGGLGVVIHSNTKIGNNVRICQNVTIGRNFGDILVPTIGDDVYIGAGSVVFGEINIGDNVIIGANSLINKDIPPNCTVIGNPFRIIETNRKKRYYDLL